MSFTLAHAEVPRLAVPKPDCRGARTAASQPAYGRLALCRGPAGAAPYYLHLPPGNNEGAPVIVVVHGISRNAGAQVRAFGSRAARLGFVTVAPRFSRGDFPGYQRLGYCRRGVGVRPDAALVAILEEVNLATGADTSRVFLFGFSGGAQFAHRFALCTPGRVKALALGSAGWYTFPDPGQPFPRGIGPAPFAHGLDIVQLLRTPALVLVGDRDTRRDGAFNASRALDAQQGRNRLERGERWVEAMRRAAKRAGVAGRFAFVTLHSCGHNFGQCAAQGNLVAAALEFFVENSRRQLPSPAASARYPVSHLLFSAAAPG